MVNPKILEFIHIIAGDVINRKNREVHEQKLSSSFLNGEEQNLL